MNSDEAATVHGDSLRGERERQRQRDGGQHGAGRQEGQEPVGPEGHGRSGDISGSHSHMEVPEEEMYLILAQVPPIPKDPDSVESECYNPHKEARKKKNGVDNPAFRCEKFKTLILHDSYF